MENVIKYLWLIIFSLTLVWSGINPKDQFTWSLEVAPAIIGLAVLAYTYKSFQLTTLVYTLILSNRSNYGAIDPTYPGRFLKYCPRISLSRHAASAQ